MKDLSFQCLLDDEYNLKNIEKKLAAPVETTVRADEFFLLAAFQMGRRP